MCRNLPYDRSAGEKPKVRLLMKKMRGVTTNVYLRENIRKTKKEVCEYWK